MAGNSWGIDTETNRSCVGCGVIQENFFGCADIAIIDENANRTTSTTTTTTVTSTLATSTLATSSVAMPTTNDLSAIITEFLNNASIAETINTTTVTTTTTTSAYNGCSSKLEFGSMSNIARVVRIYCYRMCKVRCEGILNDYYVKSGDNSGDELIKSSDNDIIACLETCPILCSCK